jgi:hypothetical protein
MKSLVKYELEFSLRAEVLWRCLPAEKGSRIHYLLNVMTVCGRKPVVPLDLLPIGLPVMGPAAAPGLNRGAGGWNQTCRWNGPSNRQAT